MALKDLFEKKGEAAPETPEVPETPKKKERPVLTPEDVQALAPLYSDVVLAIKQVYDPEIPVNIYDLGLIYELVISKEHDVFIEMTFTAPNCPMADQVIAELKTQVEDVPGVKSQAKLAVMFFSASILMLYSELVP